MMFRSPLVDTALGMLLLASLLTRADPLTEVLDQSEASIAAARQSQQHVEALSEETRSLLRDYQSTTQHIEELKSYNLRLEQQLARQQEQLQAIDTSLAEFTGFHRQLLPLTVRMIDGLERFIALDLPFHLARRQQRIATLRQQLDDPGLPTAEKYQHTLDVMLLEIGYGSSVEAWRERILIDKGEREVTLLRIGRTALLFRSTDGKLRGHWNPHRARWQRLDEEFDAAIADGIRVAQGGMPTELLQLPLPVAGPRT